VHLTAINNCRHFFEVYKNAFSAHQTVNVLEIGSLDVNGGLRDLAPKEFSYTGVDFVEGRGVDLVLSDPYKLPFDDNSFDIVISSSCFEHSEMFWLVFLEIMRVLKPKGLFYLNVPSNGAFHRYPVDCWRFYPDSGRALVTWAKRNSINATLLESYTSAQVGDIWNDFVGVFLKDEKYLSDFHMRILDKKSDITNGLTVERNDFINPTNKTEDMIKIKNRNLKYKIKQKLKKYFS
jgi:ubiquinone/menaquinone biosynthesis C-methylase UbiE